MSEATVRGYIKAVLDGVSNVGLVYDYERWAANWSDFLDLFKTTISGSSVIRGWTITCQGFSADWEEEPEADGEGQIRRTYTYKVRGYFNLNDGNATEKTAFGIVESVVNALDASGVLHGENELWTVNPPAQLTIFEPRIFGNVLCHYAEITQELTEVVTL